MFASVINLIVCFIPTRKGWDCNNCCVDRVADGNFFENACDRNGSKARFSIQTIVQYDCQSTQVNEKLNNLFAIIFS